MEPNPISRRKLVTAAANYEQLRPTVTAARAVLDFGRGPGAAESGKISREILNQSSEAMKRLRGDAKLKEELEKIVSP